MARPRMGFLAEIYHNGLVPRLTVVVGAIATGLTLVQFAQPLVLNDLPLWIWGLACAVVLLIAVIQSIPHKSQAYTYEQGGWAVELVRGSLLDYPVNSVLTSDRQASTRLEVVGAGSLIGQAIRTWYGGDEEKLECDVKAALALEPALSRDKLPLGTLIPIGDRKKLRAWLVCIATRRKDGPRTAWSELAEGYSEMWGNLRGLVLEEVNCPIVGAGFAGTSLAPRQHLIFLLLSFHGSSLEARVTPRLRIVISQRDFDPRMYRAAHAMLAELGYQR